MDFEPPALQVAFQQTLNSSASPVHHILTGSFRSISLFLLAFSPVQLTIDLVQTIPGFGPHQYIGLGPRTHGSEDVRYAYTTSWALPPQLQSWAIQQQPEGLRVRSVDSVHITATSSYITIPPPYSHIYSAGGPSAQVHALNSSGFGPHQQEIYFVRQDEWESADKTRKALRYGSHGIEFAFPPSGPPLAFIPVLGGSTIEVYKRAEDGSLTHIDTSPAPQRAGEVEDDGPRHVKVHPNGRVLYCVTEHSNYLDVYTITPPGGRAPVLTYVASRSLIPLHLRAERNGHAGADGARPTYRGDTLLLAPSTPEQPAPQSIFATTRGGEGESTPGWVGVWRLDEEGMFAGDIENNPYLVERYEAKTSGGKAHALDVRPKEGDADGAMWVLLTDDSPPHPGVRVLEWDGWLWRGGGTRLREVAAWPKPGFYSDEPEGEGEPERMQGGSHAVWLD
ncbi:hypothetical protein DFH07DRAFT_322394 [Mycena maculata]|uniref:Muconate cycloisomerase 1 n=1 Tax=Mycena maculata TaxID=230809 RepID=A0AAD7KBQ0_9AGAR|nr:hypothetical protein DFH07DRAFT_322394 [Mycena maculata]